MSDMTVMQMLEMSNGDLLLVPRAMLTEYTGDCRVHSDWYQRCERCQNSSKEV